MTAYHQSVSFLREWPSLEVSPGGRQAAADLEDATTVLAKKLLREGRLVQLLSDYDIEPLKAFAVFTSGPKPSAKVRALVTHLIAALAEGEPG